MTQYMDFEKPLAEIEGKAEELRALARSNDEMDVTEEAKALIDTFPDVGSPIIIFTGGEPMMRPDVYELIAYADAADHAKIQIFVEQVNAKTGEGASYEVRTYTVTHARAWITNARK